MKLVNIGFGNLVSADKVVAVVSPESAPIKRMVPVSYTHLDVYKRQRLGVPLTTAFTRLMLGFQVRLERRWE